MNFTEWIFPIFLGVVFALHWALRGRETRLMVLLAASFVFYGWWDVKFLALIGFVILVSWFTAQRAGDASSDKNQRNSWMWIGVAVNLGVLAVFKYFNFFVDSLEILVQGAGMDLSVPAANIILPVGISFYIFQAISYIVDVRRDDLKAEMRLRRVALYIAFFPQLVAGPIVRAASFFPQMEKEKQLSSGLLASGFKFFLLGWAYKAGLADNFASIVDPVYNDPASYSNLSVIAATIGFGAQIYFDFAGYSLMAIGVARWFGFYIPRNFNFPYASRSIDEFWRRWHISLSSWLRDYLYISLGGNRLGDFKTYRNLMLTMLLGGLWHGAAWTFVAWGFIHGAALAVHRALFGRDKVLFGQTVGAAVGIALTVLVVVLAWAPFRAASFADTLDVWSAFLGLREGGSLSLPWWAWLPPLAVAIDAWLGESGIGNRISRSEFWRNPLVFWPALGFAVAVLAALYPLKPAPFIYFQF